MIWIRVVSKSGAPLGAPVAARFSETVGDIGRGVDCTLVLPDPERRISRRQALITCRADRFFICPIGANLVVELNDAALAPDVECAFDLGAEIRIGPYLLRVESDPGAAKKAAALKERAPAPAAAFDAGNAEKRPFGLFGHLKDPARAGVFDDLLGGSVGPGRKAEVPLATPQPGPSREASRAAATVVRPAPEVDINVGEPTAGRAVPARGGAAKHVRPRAHSAPVDELIAGLYGGLGVRPPGTMARSAQQMHLIGELLRAAITGTLELLAARTISKRELGASATLVQTRANNPLKFSPHVDAALTHLLGPPERGFIAPLPAVRDAFGDLRAHQVAVLAGMRAALNAVLARFDPEELELRLAPKGMWDNLVPVNRRAKLWEQYSEQYAQILREVEGDFDTLFNRAFLQAYTAQLAELAASHDDDPAPE